VPLKGDKNTLFGIYRNRCCGAEIVISVGAVFPPCPRHQDTEAEWIQIQERVKIVGVVAEYHAGRSGVVQAVEYHTVRLN
jgi:hypothetical protein